MSLSGHTRCWLGPQPRHPGCRSRSWHQLVPSTRSKASLKPLKPCLQDPSSWPPPHLPHQEPSLSAPLPPRINAQLGQPPASWLDPLKQGEGAHALKAEASKLARTKAGTQAGPVPRGERWGREPGALGQQPSQGTISKAESSAWPRAPPAWVAGSKWGRSQGGGSGRAPTVNAGLAPHVHHAILTSGNPRDGEEARARQCLCAGAKPGAARGFPRPPFVLGRAWSCPPPPQAELPPYTHWKQFPAPAVPRTYWRRESTNSLSCSGHTAISCRTSCRCCGAAVRERGRLWGWQLPLPAPPPRVTARAPTSPQDRTIWPKTKKTSHVYTRPSFLHKKTSYKEPGLQS